MYGERLCLRLEAEVEGRLVDKENKNDEEIAPSQGVPGSETNLFCE